MKMVESLFDAIRLSDDAPDAEYEDLRGGIPVETPQERELSEGGQGGGHRVAKGWPWGGQGVAKGPAIAPKAATWYSKSIPTTEISPLWWAKATRAVKWRWDRTARQGAFWTCAALSVLLAGCGIFPQWLALLAVNVLIAIVVDPYDVLGRRVALQSRILITASAGALFVAVCAPSVAAFAVFGVITVIGGILVAMCNTEWVVTANYVSSPAIFTAMANDATGSAHRSWEGCGSKIAYTYSSEMGYPPTSNFVWAILRGVYIIGWTLGVRRVISDDELAELEDEESRSLELGRKVRELSAENAELSERIAEIEDPELVDGLRARIRELEAEAEKDARAMGYFRMQAQKAEEAKVAELQKLAEEHAKEIERINDAREKELEALRTKHAVGLAALEAQCREDVESAENALLGDSGGLRERLLLAEIRSGITSQKQLSEITGIPRTTVRRILEKWKVEGTADVGDGAA